MARETIRRIPWVLGVCVPLIGMLASGLLCLFLGYSNLVYKVFCGKGLCMICAGKISATIKGRPGRWRYFIVKRDCLPPDLQDIFGGKYRNGEVPDCWVVVHDNRSYPFGDLYWLSENDMLISKNGLWGNLGLFGKWILLSEVALHCTYDVCNDMKGLAAEELMEAIENTSWSYLKGGDGRFYRCYGYVNVIE